MERDRKRKTTSDFGAENNKLVGSVVNPMDRYDTFYAVRMTDGFSPSFY